MRGHRNSKRTILIDTPGSRNNMDRLDEMMQCRDMMEKHDYPFAMRFSITREIDEIITEGMSKRRV